VGPTESVGGAGFELIVGEDLATGLTAPVAAVPETLEGQLHVGEVTLDGIEFDVDVDGGELDIADDVGAGGEAAGIGVTGIGVIVIGAGGGRIGLHER